MDTGRWGRPRLSAFGPRPRFRAKSKVQLVLYSNSANWTEFLSSRMCDTSYPPSPRAASGPSLRSFNLMSTAALELTFEALSRYTVSALCCVSLELRKRGE